MSEYERRGQVPGTVLFEARARTHNLEELGLLVADTGIGLPASTTDFRRLTPFAVDFRHDEEAVALITTQSAGFLAESVFQWARALIDPARQ